MEQKKEIKKRKIIYPVQMALLLDVEMKNALANMSARYKMSMNRFIRISIQKELDRRLNRNASWGE